MEMSRFISHIFFLLLALFTQLRVYSAEFPLVLELEKPFHLNIENICWSPNEQHLVVSFAGSSCCHLYNTQTGKKEKTIQAPDKITAVTWVEDCPVVGQKDGKILMPGPDGKFKILGQFDQPVEILTYSPQIKILAVHTKPVITIATRGWPHDKTYFINLSLEYSSLGTTSLDVRNQYGQLCSMTYFTWSPSGNFFAFATNPQLSCLFRIYKSNFSAETGAFSPVLYHTESVDGAVRSIAWSKDDRFAAILNDKGRIEIHDRAKKKRILRLDWPFSGTLVTELSLSCDNRYLAVGGQDKLILYDLLTEKIVDCPSLTSPNEDFFKSLAGTIEGLAFRDKKNGIIDGTEGLDASKIAWSPLSPLLAVALKEHDSTLFFPHGLVIFDALSLQHSYEKRKLMQLTGKTDSKKSPTKADKIQGPPC